MRPPLVARTPRACVVAVGAVFATLLLAEAQERKSSMDDNPLGLSDEDYWTRPVPPMQSVRALRRARFDGVVIGAPHFASLERARIPLVAVRAGTYRQCAELDYHRRALLVAVEEERKVVHVLPCVQVADRVVDEDDDGGVEQTGYTASTDVLDLKERLGIAQPGTYVAWVLLREKVSNRVRVRVAPARGAYDDAEVRRLLREKAKEIQCPDPAPPPGEEGLPRYAVGEDWPAPPSERGIQLEALDRVVVLPEEGQAASRLRGVFRLPVRFHERYKPDVEEGAGLAALEPKPSAVVRVDLVVVAGDEPRYEHLTLRVPVYDPLPVADEGSDPEATGGFEVDLLALCPRLAQRPQTYFVYAVSGDVLAGPAPTALVREATLPGRD
ncbi:MAG: hypothetical protein D6731_19400 [Planctomycetota bacterium]|nr:MAG: hypothetical protein D6731_19400 [Planctomycetota bacterium]